MLTRSARVLDWVALRRTVKGMPDAAQKVVDATGRAAGFGKLWFAAAGGLALTGRRGRRAAVQGLAAYGVATALANGPLKWITRRRRPKGLAALDLPVGGRAPRTSSFPSGHTAGAFAFAVAGGGAQPVAAVPLLVAATTVGVARVHRVKHFPTDVAAGAALGVVIGTAVAVVGHRRRAETPRAEPDAESVSPPRCG